MRLVAVILIASALPLVAASAARAETAIMFEYGYTGQEVGPRLGAAAQPSGAETGVRVVEWRKCPPDGSPCTPLPDSAYIDPRCPVLTTGCELFATPGPTEPGTVFEAAFETDGVVTTRRTSAWRGKPTNTAPPAFAAPVVGQTVSVTPGTWIGGWDVYPEAFAAPARGLDVIVCRDPARTDCWDLGEAPRLDERWAGWYLMAQEDHGYGGRWSVMFGVPIAGMIPHPHQLFGALGEPGPLMARSAPMQICCVRPALGAAEPPVRRPPAATAAVRARALRHKGRLRVASVRCSLRCAVQLTVKHRAGTLVRSLTLQGTRSLSIPARRGQLRVRVVVDGKLLASGRSRTR